MVLRWGVRAQVGRGSGEPRAAGRAARWGAFLAAQRDGAVAVVT